MQNRHHAKAGFFDLPLSRRVYFVYGLTRVVVNACLDSWVSVCRSLIGVYDLLPVRLVSRVFPDVFFVIVLPTHLVLQVHLQGQLALKDVLVDLCAVSHRRVIIPGLLQNGLPLGLRPFADRIALLKPTIKPSASVDQAGD